MRAAHHSRSHLTASGIIARSLLLAAQDTLLRHRAALAALCLALLCCGARAQAPALSASDVWVRATPGSEVAAAYLTLHNGGPQPIVITGVRSARAAQAMIH